jgi:5-formaminoimidazole-4-carboxamide-1-beta-D-ribofuranosyl 5'-monophosphate synthetase
LKFFKNFTGLGEDNSSNLSSIKLYPNPSVNGQFTLRGITEPNVNVVISDLNGKVLFTENVVNTSTSHTINSGLSQGMYVISIQTKNGVIHKKWSVK